MCLSLRFSLYVALSLRISLYVSESALLYISDAADAEDSVVVSLPRVTTN